MAGKPKHPVVNGKKPCSKCCDVLPFDPDHFASQPDKKLGRRILAHCIACGTKASLAWSKTERGRRLHREGMRDYRSTPEGRDASRASIDRYAKANKKLVSARVQRWKKANPDAVIAWRESNAPRIHVYNIKARAQRALAPGKYTAEDLTAQFNAQDGKCFYCTKPLVHKIPLARGGTNFPDNIVCACARCNLRKGPRTADEFFAILRSEQSAA